MRKWGALVCSLLMISGGCVSIADVNRANYAIEAAWQKELDKLVEQYGVREYRVPKDDAMKAMRRAIQELGMVIEERDTEKGILTASAIGPRPLSQKEWEEVAKFARFPQGLPTGIETSKLMNRIHVIKFNN